MPERYQDEIEEILRRAGEVAPSDPSQEPAKADDEGGKLARASSRIPAPRFGPKRRWPVISPGKIMLAGLILFVAAALWIRPLVWVGLGMVIVAYLLFFVSPRSVSHERRWRGRAVEEYESPWQRVKRWLSR